MIVFVRAAVEANCQFLIRPGMVKTMDEPGRSRRRPMLVSSIVLRKFEFYAIQNELRIESGSTGGWRRRHRKAKGIFLFESAATH